MASGRCTVATRVADRCNADKHAVQKESEPRAFAVSHRPDSIDANRPDRRLCPAGTPRAGALQAAARRSPEAPRTDRDGRSPSRARKSSKRPAHVSRTESTVPRICVNPRRAADRPLRACPV